MTARFGLRTGCISYCRRSGRASERGQVFVEKRLNGTMKIRFKGKYLEYRLAARTTETVRATAAWALRQIGGGGVSKYTLSSAPWSIPAEGKEARPTKGKSSAKALQSNAAQQVKGLAAGAKPTAANRTVGRSGRTPALPYRPDGGVSVIAKCGHCPAPSLPWRKGGATPGGHLCSRRAADISVYA
jgi:hypothetical protein